MKRKYNIKIERIPNTPNRFRVEMQAFDGKEPNRFYSLVCHHALMLERIPSVLKEIKGCFDMDNLEISLKASAMPVCGDCENQVFEPRGSHRCRHTFGHAACEGECCVKLDDGSILFSPKEIFTREYWEGVQNETK